MHYNKTLITGTGIHSCLGTDINTFATALRSGKCGLHHDPDRKKRGYQSDLCGNVPPVSDDYLQGLSRAQQQCLSQPSIYALSAVKQALKDADVSNEYLRTHNVSLIVSNDSTAESMMQTQEIMQQRNDTRYLGAGAVFRSLNSTVSMNLASILGIHGLSLTISAACAGGGHAIGLGKMLIENEQAEMCIVVGTQESNFSSMQSFDALGVFATDCVKPFGKGRMGLAPSGGAACVVLERKKSFIERDTTTYHYSVVSGYGFSTNGNAISTPDATQEMLAMRRCLKDAALSSESITDILAHATGTPMGDKAEAHAIGMTFMTKPRIIATKGLTGHECWMAGVSQAVQADLMIRNCFIPGSCGSNDCDFAELNIVHSTIPVQPYHILCNAFGFGGTNSSFIISKV